MNGSNDAAQRKALLAGAVGNFVEWYDASLYGLFATTIAAVFFPQSDGTAALLSTFAIFGLSFAARPLGAIVFGHLGDRVGRRFTLLVSVMLMSVSTVALGLLPGYAQIGIVAPVLLLLCRLTQGFSSGGEYTGSAIFVLENAPYGRRGRYASLMSTAVWLPGVFSILVAVTITSLTTPEQLISWGWRVPFLAAAPLALVGLYLRLSVDESPEFTALRAADRIESAPVAQALKHAKKSMLICLGWTMTYAVGSYILTAFLVSYMNATLKFSRTESLVVQLVWTSIVVMACILTGYAIDRLGRKRTAVSSALGLGICIIPTFAFLQHTSLPGALLVVGVCGLFFGGVCSTTVLAVVELFPARLRSSASAMAFNSCVAAFGGTAPFVATWLVGQGYSLGPGYYLAGVCALSAVVAALGIGNRNNAINPQDRLPAHRESSPEAV
ncbi:MFS transporter [Rhodococcus sp. NPDC059968]|uniref:MFS transporter n=1 Tax=Rhodococcus sp. NPDC059968 TaxID=3347017 RepID=UPI00366B4D06